MREVGDVVGWAREVSARYEPHGLIELEDELLNREMDEDRYEWTEVRPGKREGTGQSCLWLLLKSVSGLLLFLAVLAAPVAPMYGPVAFTNGSYRGMEREFSASGAYPVTALCFLYGLLALAAIHWVGRARHYRDPGAMTLAWIYLVSAALTLPLAHGKADAFSGDIVLYVMPIWALLGASVVTLVYQFTRPRNPVKLGPRIKVARLAEVKSPQVV